MQLWGLADLWTADDAVAAISDRLAAMGTHATPFGSLPFTAVAAEQVGIGRDRLRRLVARRQVRRLLRGVFVDAAVPDSLEVRAYGLALVAPSGTVVCGRTAAWLWGVDALAMGAHRVLPRVELMVPAGMSASRRTGVLGSSSALPDTDVVLLGGALVTTPARTASDLARLLRRPDALASLDALLRLPGLRRDDVAAVLDRFAKHRGVVQARELLLLADPRAESPQESRTRLRCVDAGFPAPEPQIEVFDGLGRFVARLDMGWRWLLRALEFDGDEHHSTAQAQRWDRARREQVEQCGWRVVPVTAEHVLGRSLAFERAVAELLELEPRLTRNHPRYGGWNRPGRWAA